MLINLPNKREQKMATFGYSILIEPLPPEDGGGFVATVPDLPGCMSDGETPEEALANVRDAVVAWIEEARALGRTVPKPSRHHAAAE
jgi:antitoxin HicB